MLDLGVAKESLRIFSRRGGRLLAGAIAFYSLLSIVPLFVLALRVAGLLATETDARAVLLEHLSRWLGAAGAATLGALLAHADAHTEGGPLASVVSGLVLVYASTRLFSALKRALNAIWEVPDAPSGPTAGAKIAKFLAQRAVGFVLVMAVGVLLVVLVLLEGALFNARRAVDAHYDLPFFWRLVQSAGSFLTAAGIFGVLFAVLPDARVSWRDLAVGALVTAVLFAAGSTLIVRYVGHKASVSVFGAAGSLVVLLLWMHYSAQVFFLGAAFTAAHARRHGRGIVPS